MQNVRLVTVGFLQPSDIDDLEGQCCVVLVGTPDEVRAVAPLLYQDVSLGVFVSMSAPFPEATPSSHSAPKSSAA